MENTINDTNSVTENNDVDSIEITTDDTTTEAPVETLPSVTSDAVAKALAAVKARKAAAAAGAAATAATPKRPRASEEEKAAKLAKLNADRAERKAAREAAREAKRAERAAAQAGKVPHLAKVEKAAAKLPVLSDEAQQQFDSITASFSAADIAAIAAHLLHHNRVQATKASLNKSVNEGDTVQITNHIDARNVGQIGIVTKVQRIRTYVVVGDREVYCFTADLEVLEKAPSAQAANG